MQPDVSLIIPVFNNELYLDESLSAACAQVELSLEIIIIDDGSTDGSLKLIKAHAGRDPRIIVIEQVNQGVSAARNAGLDRASGKWLAFLDGDDWIAPGSLAAWHQQAEQGNLDCLLCNGFSFRSDPQAFLDTKPPAILSRQPWESILTGSDWMVQGVNQREWPHYVWLQFCRRSVIEAAQMRFRRDMIHEDIPWTVQLALAVKRMGFSQPPRYGYRSNPASLTQSRDAGKVHHRIASYLKVAALLKDFAKSQPTAVRKALQKQVVREMGHFLGKMRKGNVSRADRSKFATEFLAEGFAGTMLKGCSNYRELAATFKAWYMCQIWKRQKAKS
ncbi:MAG: glycosyltransferase [Prosthecobacter sp.]|uniref:glycosyltransferase n=1 Tax=Prosthecobacter sp. TaxID=1965333 RepID=UPI0025D4318F|nr:glycosyltransferase [Prosthecobacter sp.]MCF7787933.1 glycosyltransferase [Prosthecobacter sp.]